MRSLRQFFAAFVLTLALAISIHAGVMSTPVASPQPDPAPTTADGTIHTGAAGNMHTGDSEESVVAAALGLVQSVLSLL